MTVAPPSYSKEELEILEAEANTTVRNFVVTAAVLYICKEAPPLAGQPGRKKIKNKIK